jgi:hypothetical protein
MELASQANFAPTVVPGTTGDTSPLLTLLRELECNSLISRKENQLLSDRAVDMTAGLEDLVS